MGLLNIHSIYNGDFLETPNTTVAICAEITAVFSSFRSLHESVFNLKNYLYETEIWLRKWRMKINPKNLLKSML